MCQIETKTEGGYMKSLLASAVLLVSQGLYAQQVKVADLVCIEKSSKVRYGISLSSKELSLFDEKGRLLHHQAGLSVRRTILERLPAIEVFSIANSNGTLIEVSFVQGNKFGSGVVVDTEEKIKCVRK